LLRNEEEMFEKPKTTKERFSGWLLLIVLFFVASDLGINLVCNWQEIISWLGFRG
jgi:nitrogen fixation protein FixH